MQTKSNASTLKIGDEIYRKFRFSPLRIVGQTSRSWLVKTDGTPESVDPEKVPKRGGDWITDRRAWEDWKFAATHRYEIKDALESVAPEMLRAVAKLIGWAPCQCGHGPRRHYQHTGICEAQCNDRRKCSCVCYVADGGRDDVQEGD